MENEVEIALEAQEVSQTSLQQVTHLTGLNNTYIQLATSHNTRKAYRSDIRHYERWGGILPATSDIIVQYLHFYADKLNSRTLQRRLVAIKHWHTYQGFPDPIAHPAIQKTMTGILRAHGKPKEKARALLPEELACIHAFLMNEKTLSAKRDDALLQIGFFGALRRSELVAIHHEHIQWQKEGIEILLPASKTDQTHEGQYCAIPYGNETLCPVTALHTWLQSTDIKVGPVFRRIHLNESVGNHALTPLSVNHILKNRAKAAGMDIKHISSHSLRRGLATSAARANAPVQTIMRAGRWKQVNTVMEYIEASERFSDSAANNVLANMKNSAKSSDQ